MSRLNFRLPVAASLLAIATIAFAGDSPQHERHELMEGVGEAAKPVGKMFKGERDYDAAVVLESLATFRKASQKLGDLFPEGSETGEDTRAAPAIWEDRDGFNEALATWSDAVTAAVAAAPATLEDAKPVVGEVFKACKGCHDTYRTQEEE